MKQRGFTLIELLVVITILGVLASVVTLAINPVLQIQKGRDLQRKSNITTIQTALEQYRHDQSAYPAAGAANMLNATACQTSSGLVSGSINYLTKVPCDPLGTKATYNGGNYYYSTTGSTYTLEACLENKGDTDGQTTDPSGIGSATTCPSGTYYVVTNQ